MTKLEDQIVQSLRRIVRAIDVRSRALSLEYELTWPQLAALRELERLGKSQVGQLAAEMHIGAPTATGIVDRLVRDGLVERHRQTTDRRKVLVGLTSKGEELLARNPSLLNDSARKGLSRLSERERKQLRATLDRLAEMMEVLQESDGKDCQTKQ